MTENPHTEPDTFTTELPVLNLIGDHLRRQAELQPDHEFLVLGDLRLTYARTRDIVDRTARALMAAGVGPGDRVAMITDPRPEFLIHFLATTDIGAIWVGLNPKYTPGELDHVVGDAEPSMLFGLGEGAVDLLTELAARHPSVKRVVVMEGPVPDGCTGVEEFLAGADNIDPVQLEARRAAVDPMDPAYLVYTSGSTGRPKGALLTHRGSNFCNVIGVERKGLSGRSIICNLPINHVGAIGDICGRTMTGGGTIFFQPRFSPGEMMRLIEAEGIEIIAGVPTMLQMCVNHPEFDRIDLSSVELIAWGGAAMPADLLERLLAKTGAGECTTGYGMTETTGGVTYSGLTDSVELLTTTVGKPDPRQPLRIWHPDGRVAGPGEAGEIQVKGDYTMAGYWRLPEATAEAFTADGWLHTGDPAELRDDGYVRIVGRMSEMFKSGGYNVYPREVELALEEHPLVDMAAVISIPDARFQEVGVAYVMGSGELDPDELRDFARQRLANYKIPKQIIVLESLPMLPIGKVDKKALRNRHPEGSPS
ncbi:MAG TPA: long-chain fatty acid--CoA ligase [Acidimicrobiales bacterium]|nr:long-chain fatty acid--CoA ligase [Acidimicrobiales bacterium]